MSKVTMTIRMSDTLHTRIRKFANANDLTINDIVTRSLRNFIEIADRREDIWKIMADSSINSSIKESIKHQVEANDEVVEKAVELSKQDGAHGVMVVMHIDGTVSAQVSQDVPYGEVHYMSDMGLRS